MYFTCKTQQRRGRRLSNMAFREKREKHHSNNKGKQQELYQKGIYDTILVILKR